MAMRNCLDDAIRLKMVCSGRDGREEEESGNIPEPAPPPFLYTYPLKGGSKHGQRPEADPIIPVNLVFAGSFQAACANASPINLTKAFILDTMADICIVTSWGLATRGLGGNHSPLIPKEMRILTGSIMERHVS